MWVRRAAIRPVPSYAQLPARALTDVEDQLGEDDEASRSRLDQALARFEATQPALADRVADALGRPIDETALALGHFLTLSIWLAFDAVFGSDLAQVSDTALASVEEALRLDEQIRLSDPAEAVDSDDVVAMEQPDALAFVHEHLDAALEANATDVDVDDVHAIYHVVLVEILALSYAVRQPPNWLSPSPELQA